MQAFSLSNLAINNFLEINNSILSRPKKPPFHSPPHPKKRILQAVDLSIENISESSKPSIFVRRFKIKQSNFFKKSSMSLSPINNREKTTIKDDKFDFSKIRQVKKTSQESEIRLQHLYNKLKEFGEQEEFLTEKLKICFEMINSVFM